MEDVYLGDSPFDKRFDTLTTLLTTTHRPPASLSW